MAFTPKNYVDKVGPVLSASWLNALDNIQGYFTVTSTGLGTLGPPTATGATLTIIGGSSGVTTPALVLTSGGTTHFQVAGHSVSGLDFSQDTSGNAYIQNLSNEPIQLGVTGLLSLQLDGTRVAQAWEGVDNVAAAAFQPVATVESGSFTGTLTNVTGSHTATLYWRRVGPLVFLTLPGNLIGPSTTTTAPTITGLPAQLVPAAAVAAQCSCLIQDNTANEAGYVSLPGGSQVITLQRANGTTTFTNTGNKGTGGFTMVYTLS